MEYTYLGRLLMNEKKILPAVAVAGGLALAAYLFSQRETDTQIGGGGGWSVSPPSSFIPLSSGGSSKKDTESAPSYTINYPKESDITFMAPNRFFSPPQNTSTSSSSSSQSSQDDSHRGGSSGGSTPYRFSEPTPLQSSVDKAKKMSADEIRKHTQSLSTESVYRRTVTDFYRGSWAGIGSSRSSGSSSSSKYHFSRPTPIRPSSNTSSVSKKSSASYSKKSSWGIRSRIRSFYRGRW